MFVVFALLWLVILFGIPAILIFSVTRHIIKKVGDKYSSPEVNKDGSTSSGNGSKKRIHWSIKYTLYYLAILFLLSMVGGNIGSTHLPSMGDIVKFFSAPPSFIWFPFLAAIIIPTFAYLTRKVESKVYKFALWILFMFIGIYLVGVIWYN